MNQQLSIHFGQFHIRENFRPDWMINSEGERLELDFFIEVQGKQHYTFVPHFHGSYENFCKRLSRDYFKRHVCGTRRIKLFEVDNKLDASLMIEKMYQYVPFEKFVVDPTIPNDNPPQTKKQKKIIKVKKVAKGEILGKKDKVMIRDFIGMDSLLGRIDEINRLLLSGLESESKLLLKEERSNLKIRVNRVGDFLKSKRYQQIRHYFV